MPGARIARIIYAARRPRLPGAQSRVATPSCSLGMRMLRETTLRLAPSAWAMGPVHLASFPGLSLLRAVRIARNN